MNLDRKLYGRLTIGKTQISLGYATPVDLVRRLIEQYRNHKSTSQAVSVVVEWSSEQLTTESILNDEHRLVSEFQHLLTEVDPDEETDWPGITVGRVAEVTGSREYEAYQKLAANPTMRLGLTQLAIEQVKLAYFNAYPDCAPHFPKWVD